LEGKGGEGVKTLINKKEGTFEEPTPMGAGRQSFLEGRTEKNLIPDVGFEEKETGGRLGD